MANGSLTLLTIDIPIVANASGYVPQSPTTLNALLISNVTAIDPGYTANLPGSLVEDISSTDTYALLQCDSSVAELVNSITPFGANPYILNQLATVYGVQPQAPFNTSVYVTFTSDSPGWTIVQGFLVSDGTYQYVIQDGGIIGAGGTSTPLLAVASTTGAWAVPPGSVDQIASSFPSTITLSCTNVLAGVPAATAELESDWRARTLQAGLAASQGMTRYLKTLVQNVPGVQFRLVSARLVVGADGDNAWEIIVGGGDTYQVGNAIFQSLFDLTTLTGSVMTVSGITNANPAQVTTTLYHGLSTGDTTTIRGATGATPLVSAINGVPFIATVTGLQTFTIPLDTTSLGAYTGNGFLDPNSRNTLTTILDYPDSYTIPVVIPPQLLTTVTAIWNTYPYPNPSSYVNPAAVAAAGNTAIVNYINSIPVGQPINELQMASQFQTAVSSIVAPQNLVRLVFTVSITFAGLSIGLSPEMYTYQVVGDPESFWYTTSANVTVTQG